MAPIPHARPRPLLALALLSLGLAGLGGCVAAAVGAGGAGVKTLTESRTAGAVVDDTTIKLSLNAKLIGDSFSLFRNVDTTVHEGRVVLTGSVKKPDQRIEAERLAWNVSGVREVNNEIQVEDKSGIWDGLRDSRICGEIRTRLTFASDIHSQNYSIECVNQQVYVTGIAADQAEQDRVRTVIRGVESVKDVTFYTRLRADKP